MRVPMMTSVTYRTKLLLCRVVEQRLKINNSFTCTYYILQWARTHIARAVEQERNNCGPENDNITTMMRYYFFIIFFFFNIYIYILFLLSYKTIIFTFKTTATTPASSAEVKTKRRVRGDYIIDTRKVRYDLNAYVPPTWLSETLREEKGIRINSR